MNLGGGGFCRGGVGVSNTSLKDLVGGLMAALGQAGHVANVLAPGHVQLREGKQRGKRGIARRG